MFGEFSKWIGHFRIPFIASYYGNKMLHILIKDIMQLSPKPSSLCLWGESLWSVHTRICVCDLEERNLLAFACYSYSSIDM